MPAFYVIQAGRWPRPPTPPSERASELIEKLPSSPSLITKTGTALLGVGAAAAAISQELYVVNEETIVLVASIMFFTYLGKVRFKASSPIRRLQL